MQRSGGLLHTCIGTPISLADDSPNVVDKCEPTRTGSQETKCNVSKGMKIDYLSRISTRILFC